ncbi:hypothetical protein BBC27_08035 [Acidithiobacillus ferrivorans]|uniref:Uncharacterized protein n=1 Tax=Acidithiobacillus ferrivorans TaxID=160808 RepID=A0A1B9C0A1_9PROT|nr:hypothetical protein [Acidithiobacillus ferrivorans]OCB03406.1 hypothetical protein BBC27_08035 [Acidithiobacillus ferrivorans]
MKKLIAVAVIAVAMSPAAFAATPRQHAECQPGAVIYKASLPGDTSRGALLADIKNAGSRYLAVCKRAPARVKIVITNAK